MSFNSLKLGTVVLLASMIVTGGCSSKSGDGISADQKQQLDNLSQLKEQAIETKTASDTKAKEYDKQLADLAAQKQSADEQTAQLKKLADDQAQTQATLDAYKAQQDNKAQSQNQTAEQQAAMTKIINDANALNEQQKAQLTANADALAKQQAAIAANVAALKVEYPAAEVGRKAMNDALISGQPFPVVAIVYGTTQDTHNQILAEIRKTGVVVRDGFNANESFSIIPNARSPYPGDTQGIQGYAGIGQAGQGQSKFIFMASTQLPAIEDFVSKKLYLLISVSPFYRTKVVTYVDLKYSTPKVGRAPNPFILIGETAPITVGLAYPNMSLDDVFSYTNLPKTCTTVTPQCFTDLRTLGYIDGGNKKIATGETVSSFLTRTLNNSLDLIDKNGRQSRVWTPSDSVIVDVTLVNKVYAEVSTGDSQSKPKYIEMPFATTEIQTDSQYKHTSRDFENFLYNTAKTLDGPVALPAKVVAPVVAAQPVVAPAAPVVAPSTAATSDVVGDEGDTE